MTIKCLFILDERGSSRRSRTTRNRMKLREVESNSGNESNKEVSGIFGNLAGIIESDGSDKEGNKEHSQKRKKIKLIDSDEESS